MIAMIVAVAQDNVIGKDNQLLWHLPKDLQYFKALTDGHIIVMGRKTFESLPKLLPNRTHWVLTNQKDYVPKYEGARLFYSLEELLEAIKKEEKVFVIGGEQIYRSFLPYAEKIFVTEVDASFEGDAFFPILEEKRFVRHQVIEGECDEKHPWPYRFVTYKRIEE